MKVILLEEVRGKGGEGDIITVEDGFANNYLLRKRMAVKATPGNIKQLEQRRNNIAKREEVRIADAESLKTALEENVITVPAKVGEEGQLFGSVTNQMIASAIKEDLDIDIDRRRIETRQSIKTVGEHEVEIDLYRDIKAAVKVIVVDAGAPDGTTEVAEVSEVTIIDTPEGEVVEIVEEVVEEPAE